MRDESDSFSSITSYILPIWLDSSLGNLETVPLLHELDVHDKELLVYMYP